jgi:hypothetical protein
VDDRGVSELGGSEWYDEEAEIQRAPDRDLPWLDEPYSPEGPNADDRNRLEPEEEGDFGFGELVTEDEFAQPADGPPSLDEQIELELFGRLGDQDEGERYEPQQDDSIDRDDLARDLKAFLAAAKDAPFTGDELQKVKSTLRDTQEQLTRLEGLSNDQKAMIQNLSERLDRSSEHLGRKDWLIMAIGAGAALLIAGAVPPVFMLHIGAKFIHEIALFA